MSVYDFLLPDVGEGLAEAEIVEWLVKLGDTVDEFQPVVAIETAKSVIEIPSPVAGVVAKFGAEPGAMIDVGDVLLTLEVAEDSQTPAQSEPSASTRAAAEAAPPPPSSADHGQRRPRAAPSIRRLARELGVDLSDVVGQGPGGRIIEADVRQAADAPPDAARASEPVVESSGTSGTLGGQVVQLSNLRRTIAARMTATAEVPQITSMREVEVGGLVEWRKRVNARRSTKISYLPFFAMCMASALREVPELNASFDPAAEQLTYHSTVDLGLAVATDDGLLVAVVREAERKSLLTLADEIADLTQRARTRSLAPSEQGTASATLSNYGSYGGWYGTPLLRLPEISITGFGRIDERPWVVDGSLTVAPVIALSVSVDHRVADGELLGRYAGTLERTLSDPLRLLEGSSAWS